MYLRELVGATVKERMGLGLANATSSRKEKLTDKVGQISEHDLLLTIVDKGVQRKLLMWENTIQLDLG